MSLRPRRPMFPLDRLFDDFWGSHTGIAEPTEDTFLPRIDVKDNTSSLEITAELPGVKKEDIHVSLEDGILTLSAESHQEDKEEKEGKIIRQERRYGKYLRSFNVGKSIQDSDIKASFENGVLKLTAPKASPEQPSAKRIEIN